MSCHRFSQCQESTKPQCLTRVLFSLLLKPLWKVDLQYQHHLSYNHSTELSLVSFIHLESPFFHRILVSEQGLTLSLSSSYLHKKWVIWLFTLSSFNCYLCRSADIAFLKAPFIVIPFINHLLKIARNQGQCSYLSDKIQHQFALCFWRGTLGNYLFQ